MSLVSIIIPSFRQPEFLARAIESCLGQDHEDLEVIVVDDRSRDASLGLALSYASRDERVRVFEAEHNGGLGRARNIGLTHASGDYLCFLDSDDYLLDRSLSARLDALPAATEQYGDALAGVYGDWQHVGESVDDPQPRAARSNMAVVSASSYTGENAFICSAPLVRRDLVLRAGGFPEGLPMLEDFALWARILAEGGVFVPVQHVVATYRQRPNSMLRGDGVVVMSDYVEIINDWMFEQGVELVDGGGLDAWLDGRPPMPFGRMSWNVPSILGNFGRGFSESSVSAPPEPARVDDFMNDYNNAALTEPLLAPAGEDTAEAEVVVIVRTLEQSVQAIAIIESLANRGRTARVYVEDPTNWVPVWPLALRGWPPRALKNAPVDAEVVDLSQPGHPYGAVVSAFDPRTLVSEAKPPSGGCVLVGDELVDYPALDAWISVASHALVDASLDVEIVATAKARGGLGGWRSRLLSFDSIASAQVVIVSSEDDASLVSSFAPTVIFNPSGPNQTLARTSDELRAAISGSLSR